MSTTGIHRVHCFDCRTDYEQSGPHPRVCGHCGSHRIGVHSDPTGEVWSVSLVNSEGTKEAHSVHKSEVGDVVQAIVNSGVEFTDAVVVTPPMPEERAATERQAALG